MTQIIENYFEFKKGVPDNVSLVAVSKTKPEEDILKLYKNGQRIFGENKVQELVRKSENLPEDIEWHMIGHLQSNKVKYIAPFINLIHGVDSFKLLKTINKEAAKNNRTILCLLQMHIAMEETKFGLSEDELDELLKSESYKELGNIKIAGLMGMATFTEDYDQVRKEFRKLKTIFEELKSGFFKNEEKFKVLSMGMSNDYKIAIEEGANMLRIGSLIFGSRNYSN